MNGDPGEILRGLGDVARAHREHERYHSVFKLEEAVAWRRDSNALKLLSDRWSGDGDVPARSETGGEFGPAGCADLNDTALVATTGILFMEGESEPGELIAMKGRLAAASARYGRLSRWLAGHAESEWERLSVLLVPEFIAAAPPRFAALARTTAAADAYRLVAHLLTAAGRVLEAQDLTPGGVRADPGRAAAMIHAASSLIDDAAARIAEAGVSLGDSDADWSEFIRIADRLPGCAALPRPDR
ncbi:hypothetical protein [Nocardia nova]|uniref:hypothetical protein n=1 Tax=Nocardia nova TaxID=37330 RepID=UPI0033F0642E